MGAAAGGGRTEAIMRELARLRAERDDLDARIRLFESQLRLAGAGAGAATTAPAPGKKLLHAGGLSPDAIRRHSRHLLLPEFGVQGQRRLSRSSVLVVGAGRLGSPVAMYLAACGVGSLGIVDGDDVELGDLHGQTMHMEAYVGQPKVKAAAAACRAVNSSVKVVEYHLKLKPTNALDIVRQYDIVVDATDSLPSRYMLSDCCVLVDKPLISGSAFGLQGQLTVYNHDGGPCYRCLFPSPPASAAYQSSDSGVLGVVPGVVGCLQALETIKVATGVGEPLCGRMLLFDALSSRFKTAKVHRQSPTCAVCGENPSFTKHVFKDFDYENFARSSASVELTTASQQLDPLPESAMVTCRDYKQLRQPHLLLDVRPAHEFQIASLPGSLNIPLRELRDRLPRLRDALNEVADSSSRGGRHHDKQRPRLYFVCRRGDDAEAAVRVLCRESGFVYASCVVGGLEAWARDVDPEFPVYW